MARVQKNIKKKPKPKHKENMHLKISEWFQSLDEVAAVPPGKQHFTLSNSTC